MAEEKKKKEPRWVDEDFSAGIVEPPDDIACKDCEYALPPVDLGDGQEKERYKFFICEAFQKSKPYDVLWKKAECPFYKKDEQGAKIDEFIKKYLGK